MTRLVAAASMVCTLLSTLVSSSCGAGKFDRDKFERIVDRVRAQGLQPGQTYRFKLDSDLNPESLKPLPDPQRLGDPGYIPRGQGRGLVSARLNAAGKLWVSIETRDNGHAGEYGFAYRESGITDAELENSELEELQKDRIDERWVRWFYNLD
jgi:hypothetical protein